LDTEGIELNLSINSSQKQTFDPSPIMHFAIPLYIMFNQRISVGVLSPDE
jgi:hypothetical protein